MASVIREIVIDASPEDVWAAVGDFAGGPLQMAPDVVVECRLDEAGVRSFVFADGTAARERLVTRDDESRRIVYGWVGKEVAHDNTSMQVLAEGETQSRLVWIHDTLPDELTGWLANAMDQLTPVIQRALRSPTETR